MLLSLDFAHGFGPVANFIEHIMYMGFCLPLSTGKWESGKQIKEKKGTYTGGQYSAFYCYWGQAKNWLSNCPPSLSVKEGPALPAPPSMHSTFEVQNAAVANMSLFVILFSKAECKAELQQQF